MTKQQIPQWLHSWQSEFKKCLEVWQEMNDKALSKQLSPEQADEVGRLIQQWNETHERLENWPNSKDESYREHKKIFCEELMPLGKQIQRYWEEHGYTDFLIHENGKVGVKSINGGTAIPPQYDDVCFTYDGDEFFYQEHYVVKKDGKWGVVSDQQEILIPFEYDMIIRKPEKKYYFILMKNGKQGVATWDFDKIRVNIKVPCQMDAIYHVPDMDLTLFSKEGKWGWWWNGDSRFYHNYCEPEYNGIFVRPIEEVHQMEDDEDELFVARKGDHYHQILYWTSK